MGGRLSGPATLLLACVLVFSMAQPANAAAPKGTYECFSLGYWIKLKGKNRYTVQTGGGGKWRGKKKNVAFRTGPMKFAYGKFRRDSTGAPLIDLYFKDTRTSMGICPKITRKKKRSGVRAGMASA